MASASVGALLCDPTQLAGLVVRRPPTPSYNHPPPSILMPPGGLGWDPSPVFMPVTTHFFSIHCYRNMLATDFAAYGLPRSL